MNNGILVKGIEVVGVLFAAFGGFLVGIAPPHTADARFAVGLSSFIALIILFIISALSKRRFKNYWLIAGCALVVLILAIGYGYKASYDRLVFEYPPGSADAEQIAGTELTSDAADYIKENHGISSAQLLFDFGGLPNKELVWKADSIRNARMQLIVLYVSLVLSISGAIFSLTEGVLAQPPSKRK